MVNPFSALKEPPQTFIEDDDDEAAEELGVSNDHWFSSASLEIFALDLAIGMRNLDLLSSLLTSFQSLWTFTHLYGVVEQSVQRCDAETLQFVMGHRTLADTFEILEQAQQFKALQMMTTKSLEGIGGSDAKSQERLKVAKIAIKRMS